MDNSVEQSGLVVKKLSGGRVGQRRTSGAEARVGAWEYGSRSARSRGPAGYRPAGGAGHVGWVLLGCNLLSVTPVSSDARYC